MFLTVIFIIISLSFLVLVHELGHFLVAKKKGLLVEEFGIGFPPRIFAKKIGETEYSFNWLPFGGFVRIYGERVSALEGESKTGADIDKSRSFVHTSAWNKFMIMAAGVSINFIVGWLLLSLVFMLGSKTYVGVAETADNSPAAVSGIEGGDILIDFESSEEFVSYISLNRGSEITLNLIRSGEPYSVDVIPRVESVEGEGYLGVVLMDRGFESLGFFESLREGMVVSVLTMAEIIKAFGGLVSDLIGTGKISEGVVGPIGIFTVANQLQQLGFVYLLQLIGLISLNLAVLNIIPFPALDGGRILFLIIEKIKGSPISMKKEIIANTASFLLLIILMIIVTTRDIIKLF
ncbi:MAG: hypothetical protein COU06_01475 [Candidatus Harrisonbacteria bacterium CG10_big_fil_rev_8_21_14_0_10_38_8]|uniref:Peptidase M50 domain-containing protein n=1 Tax=Candidatus Harrisonbacteria bacterium CG10_big_fil_rev_8_21_14_0_10_38_8 TaxID=1974582 RepID=A0A2M6WK10_9BACT|nr:MAG: hypothetical protein COU06_01475 [Candidatus Harrisonbacteria bacterium CG10_big_fil_rev_8_21_14_0_10_38_8]